MGMSAGELMAMERFFIFSFFLISSSLATIDQHHTPLTLKGYYYFLFFSHFLPLLRVSRLFQF
jgi:hypothetical protein